MAENKTQFTDQNVEDFLNNLTQPGQLEDSKRLIQLMEKVTQKTAKMYGSSIIGCGQYTYQYDSGHSGVAPIISFSPRKNAISLYIFIDTEDQKLLLSQLGKYKMGKSCIYIKKLDDISEDILEKMMFETVNFIQSKYHIS